MKTKNMDEPHVWKHFNNSFPACSAISKRTRSLCTQPAMKNGKCRFHGGKSTGAITETGKLKRNGANFRHGFYSKQSIAERKKAKKIIRSIENEIASILTK